MQLLADQVTQRNSSTPSGGAPETGYANNGYVVGDSYSYDNAESVDGECETIRKFRDLTPLLPL
ncbi:unnamed protein product [Gongylonema pulchrum]|uniref:Uncharacterized protein n=1 Tax=Gongylonema pulchrum TaxID=637853 RepID=A0A3P6RUZ6_9BILA|nr:unnamed protein product [Gongylonema pulchrum]